MHGQLASGARCLNCIMSVHLDPIVVCTSSEDSGQCVYVCAHMHILARVFTARTHKECVLMRAHVCMQVCTYLHTFFVCTRNEDYGQCAHACTLAWTFLMEAAIINNI